VFVLVRGQVPRTGFGQVRSGPWPVCDVFGS